MGGGGGGGGGKGRKGNGRGNGTRVTVKSVGKKSLPSEEDGDVIDKDARSRV